MRVRLCWGSVWGLQRGGGVCGIPEGRRSEVGGREWGLGRGRWYGRGLGRGVCSGGAGDRLAPPPSPPPQP